MSNCERLFDRNINYDDYINIIHELQLKFEHEHQLDNKQFSKNRKTSEEEILKIFIKLPIYIQCLFINTCFYICENFKKVKISVATLKNCLIIFSILFEIKKTNIDINNMFGKRYDKLKIELENIEKDFKNNNRDHLPEVFIKLLS